MTAPTAGAISNRTFVALDLETTGLDPDNDTIIEVGAVKFRASGVLDTFQTFVNPGRAIPEFIQHLTGIAPRQVERAPRFPDVVARLVEFVGDSPIVGQNISFDLRFLASHGLSFPNPAYDTWDLASVFLPTTMEYSLGALARLLAVEHISPHRALEDAQATREVFIALLHRASQTDPGLLDFISTLSSASRWGLDSLLAFPREPGTMGRVSGLSGLDQESLSTRLARPQRRRTGPTSDNATEPLVPSPEEMASLVGPDGPFAANFPGFEHRPEQERMLAQVSDAIFQGHHLVVEAGTGVGKSMAYLLPAMIFAATQGQRVVISTNTINLQDQLVHKDIPTVIEVLEQAGIIDEGQVQAALLKGRANYLCLDRWRNLARSATLTVDEARLVSKAAVWLQETASGDRNEVNLAGRDAAGWGRISAGHRSGCQSLRSGGPCFYRNARDHAEHADIVVVNHSLLLIDLARGGGLIPEYQHLVIDEAHNLEEEATRQLGFGILQNTLDEKLEPSGRIINGAMAQLAQPDVPPMDRQTGERAATDLQNETPRLTELWARMWASVSAFLSGQRNQNADSAQVLITPPMHRHQSWRDLALAWENLDVSLGRTVNVLAQLHNTLDGIQPADDSGDDSLTAESAALQEDLSELREQLSAIIGAPTPESIIWIAQDQNRGDLSLHCAPLGVDRFLAEMLFDQKKSVVLTSATLSSQGNCEFLRQRFGVEETTPELVVGSPFDYQRAALLMIPDDMPQPNADRYIESVSRVVTDLGVSLDGHTMALFTSYAALRAVAHQVRNRLSPQGVQVLAQGMDGSPQQLIRRFTDNPESVLLGTSSFWEGVDLPEGLCKALVLTRLPFQVPSDPIVKARSDQYGDAFNQYSIPQAVLRFRQGIGRLIRRKTDRGAIVVLDRRITGRNYGQAFLRSIPPCSLKPSNLASVGDLASEWTG